MTVAMLLLASGRSVRFGGDVPKVFLECRGRSILERSLERLALLSHDREIVLAVHPEDRSRFLQPLLPRLQQLGLTRVVAGGNTRQQSMQNALAAAGPHCDLVLVHDAARPFFPVAAARTAIDRARVVGAALLAIKAPDTLKQVDAALRVVATIDRGAIWYAQTPQVARRELLERALARADQDGFSGTDDMSLLEHIGATVEVVAGATTNLKITTREDLAIAAAIAALEDPA